MSNASEPICPACNKPESIHPGVYELCADLQKTARELRMAYEESGQLENEMERLRASIYPADAEPGDTIVKTFDDGSMLVDTPGGQRRRVKFVGTVEMQQELAARDADVRELRDYLATKEHDFSKRNLINPMIAIRHVIAKVNELPTMKDVK